jgi:hypothetical protein
VPPALPDPRLPRRRLALLSLVGALMVALPLGQVLRYQGAELQTLAEQRAALDPIARAVDVQRSLLLHRPLASAVLRGQKAQEPERQLRQADVDARMVVLGETLAAGPWPLAAREGEALRFDWALLAHQVATRSLAAPQSDDSHRLRVEQVLQVIDLLADALTPVGAAGEGAAGWQLARRLPHRAAKDAAADGAAWPAQMAAFEGALKAAGSAVDNRQAQAKLMQRALLAALAALGLVQLVVLRQLWRGPARRRATPAEDGQFAAPPHPDRHAAGHLMQRLRRGEDTASAPLDTR